MMFVDLHHTWRLQGLLAPFQFELSDIPPIKLPLWLKSAAVIRPVKLRSC